MKTRKSATPKKAKKAAKVVKKSVERKLSPRALIRNRFTQSGAAAAVKFGKTLKGVPEATVLRYVAYFGSKAGQKEEAKRAKRAAKRKSAA